MVTDEGTFTLGDFTRLPGKFQALSMVPQWDFLDFIIAEAENYPSFRLQRQARVTGLLEEDGVVRGVRYRTAAGEEGELRALLTIAADGRHSTVRDAARLSSVEYGAPIDLLWYRIPKGSDDPEGSFARLFRGRFLPMIDRGTYWQGAYTMPKGAFATMKAAGIETLREDLRAAMPFLADRVDTALRSWDDTGFLEVRVNRLRRWYSPGVLCIGDAAHAMSPVAGVGINLAIQDAVAAANLLVAPLLNGEVTTRDLARVQRRRSLPARLTQRVQLQVQKQIIPRPSSGDSSGSGIPPALRVMTRLPLVQRYFSRFMAIGVRNEHVRPVHAAQPSVQTAGDARL
jgi:2-polyprenyl-6-methoxyphenol hydroxylase-like FAD-dependent oxidoreductase